MKKIIRFEYDETELLNQAFDIRRIVYIEEQKVPEEEEFEFEEESIHYLIFHKKKPVGTARYRITKSGIKLERFAILNEVRGKGFGKAILIHLLNEVRPLGKRIYLNAQTAATEFYKQQSFVICGPKFMEAGIEHYPMEFDKSIDWERARSLAVCRK